MNDDVLSTAMSQLMALPLSHLSVGWQGGEPTLMGLKFFETAVSYQQQFGRGQCVGNSLQTNGLLIDQTWAGFFSKYNFLIGLSLDGPAHVHDHYRTRQGGIGTWSQVVDSGMMMQDSGVMVNALCVVNNYSARFAHETYPLLKQLGYSYQQYIPCVEPSPLGTADASPFSVSSTAYGDFLITLFDLWIDDFRDGYPTISVRFFDALLNRYLHRTPSDCTLLASCGNYLVLEHNGDLFPCDFFVDVDYRLGNVLTHSLNAVYNSETMHAFGQRKNRLPEPCVSCDWRDYCRGGCPKDRPLDDSSYLCNAFKRFFSHAHETLKNKARQIERLEIEKQQRDVKEAMNQGGLKVGRNAPCPCGSGEKFKKCCLYR